MSVFVLLKPRSATSLLWLACAWLCFSSLISGCSALGGMGRRKNNDWLESGSLALSRPVPNPMTESARARLASFEPSSATETGSTTSILISRKDRTITALRPGQSPLVIKSDGAEKLKSGSYSITLKEENPLWYAPSVYFTKRSLVVPAEGSRARFRRAALGTKSLYLNDRTPIHSGPIWIPEIGGIRVPEEQMSEIFSSIEIGTRVEVR